jgi:hypothetical protein
MVRLGPHRLWGYSFDAKLEYLSSSMVHANSGQSSKDGIASHYGLRPEELKGTNDFNNDLLNKYLKVNYIL